MEISLSTSVLRYIWNIFYFGAESILNIIILNSNVPMFGSSDVPGLNVLTFLTYRYFAYFFWCQFVEGWRKLGHSLTFYFVDSLLAFNVSGYICLSWGAECGGLKVSMKTRKLVFNEQKWIDSLCTEKKTRELAILFELSIMIQCNLWTFYLCVATFQ